MLGCKCDAHLAAAWVDRLWPTQWSSTLSHGCGHATQSTFIPKTESCAATGLHPCLQIEKHDSHESSWFIHDGNVYDATKFLKDHPGKIMLLVPGVATGACCASGSAHSGTPLHNTLTVLGIPHSCSRSHPDAVTLGTCSRIEAHGKQYIAVMPACKPWVTLPCCCHHMGGAQFLTRYTDQAATVRRIALTPCCLPGYLA